MPHRPFPRPKVAVLRSFVEVEVAYRCPQSIHFPQSFPNGPGFDFVYVGRTVPMLLEYPTISEIPHFPDDCLSVGCCFFGFLDIDEIYVLPFHKCNISLVVGYFVWYTLWVSLVVVVAVGWTI